MNEWCSWCEDFRATSQTQIHGQMRRVCEHCDPVDDHDQWPCPECRLLCEAYPVTKEHRPGTVCPMCGHAVK